MKTLNRDQYSEQMKNLNLFLAGKKLERSNQELYKLLYRKAASNKNYIINSTVALIALTIGWQPERTLVKLIELKKLNLFHKMEMADGRVIISLKNLEHYARVQN